MLARIKRRLLLKVGEERETLYEPSCLNRDAAQTNRTGEAIK